MPDILDAADQGPAIAEILGEKLKEIDARIEALRQLREQLAVRIAMECPLVGGHVST